MMPPAVFPAEGDPLKNEVAYTSPYSKAGAPIYDPYRVRMLRAWPLGTDFSPDNLEVRD